MGPYTKNITPAVRLLVKQVEKIVGTQPITIFIAGGFAAIYHCGQGEDDDIDAFFDRPISTSLIDEELNYTNELGQTALCEFDKNYNPTLGMMHENYDMDAIPWDFEGIPKNISVKVLAPLDLAITKLDRFSERDRQDIMNMAKIGLFDSQGLMARAQEALQYAVGNTTKIANTIRMVCTDIDKAATKPRELGL